MKRSVAFFVLASLPSLAHPEQVGRLMYFRGPKPLTQFAPVALSSSLTCNAHFDNVSRSCTLKLINNVSTDDLAQMATFQADDPRLQFTPLATEQLEDVHESFQKMDRDVGTPGVRLPGTLALSEDPYVSFTFSKSPRTVAKILAAYEKDGIGSYTAEFSFDAERTEDYLELVDTAPLVDVIEKTQGGISPDELQPALIEAVRAGGVSSNNMTDAEAVGIAYRTIVANFFKLTREPMLYPDPSAASGIGNPLVLVDETRSPVKGRCTASLPLKKSAQATISCQEATK